MKTTVPKFIATIATGLLAGAFLYGFLNLVPTFYEVPQEVHLRFRVQLMNHNSTSMQALMAVSIITPLWYAFVNRRVRAVVFLSILSSSMALVSLLVTRFGNVPINMLIRSWSETQPPADWLDYLHRWDSYNLVRSIAAIVGFILFVTATHVKSLNNYNYPPHTK